MRRAIRQSSCPRHKGASLLEVLISVLVLSIGLLGTASLQMTSKRVNLEARERTTATIIAQELIERMRSNTRQLGRYTDAGAGLTLDGATMVAVSCTGACTGAELADHDLYSIELAMNGDAELIDGNPVGGLSAPMVCITGPDGGSATYTVSIAWRGRTPLTSPAADPCGVGSGRYDSNDGANADVHRRVLTLRTFIAEPI